MIVSLDEFAAALPRAQMLPVSKQSLAARAGDFFDLWQAPGTPGVGQLNATLPGALCDHTTPGALPFVPPVGGMSTYVGRLTAAAQQAQTLIVYDRLWHNRVSLASTGAQAINPVAGEMRYADGAGVELWAHIHTALANTTAATWTATFTDQDGAVGKLATAAYGASGLANRWIPFALPAGSNGVRSVQSFQTSVVQGGGTMGLVLVRRLAEIPILTPGVAGVIEALSALQEVRYGACLGLAVMTGAGTTTGHILGRADIIQG